MINWLIDRSFVVHEGNTQSCVFSLIREVLSFEENSQNQKNNLSLLDFRILFCFNTQRKVLSFQTFPSCSPLLFTFTLHVSCPINTIRNTHSPAEYNFESNEYISPFSLQFYQKMNYSPFGPAPNSSNNPNVIPMMGMHNNNNNNRP